MGLRSSSETSDVDLYSGSSHDWAYRIGTVKYSYTMELRDDGDNKFLLPQSEIIPSGEETWEAVKVIASQVIRDERENKFKKV